MNSNDQIEKALTKKWDRLTIADDRMFAMVMENRQICLELLRRIFPGRSIQRIKQPTTQKQVTRPLDVRSTRFDVYIRDDHDRTYIVEMQVANRHNLPYRMRYYLGQSDYNVLGAGDSYEKLKHFPTYVIFFCDFDYYQQGRSKYQFEHRCLEDLSLAAGDGQQMIVFNAQADDFHDNIEMEGFLKLMHNHVTAADPLVKRITDEMTRIKQDPERRRSYMKYELDLADARNDGIATGLQEGKNEGRQEAIESAAKMLVKLGMSNDKIVHNLMDAYDLSASVARHYLKTVK